MMYSNWPLKKLNNNFSFSRCGFRYKLILILTLLWSLDFCLQAEEKEDTTGILFKHILDSDSWEIFPFLPPIHLPTFHIGPIDIIITKHTLMLIIAALILALGYGILFGGEKLIPRGFIYNILELPVAFVRDEIVYPVMGEDEGKKWLPFFSTTFLLILFSNSMGLFPCFSAATSNFSITLGLALIMMGVIFYNGIKRLGFIGYFKNMMPEGIHPILGVPIMLIDFVSNIIKGLVLAIRLFANMFAGHMVIFAFLMLCFIVGWAFAFIAVPLAFFTYLLEVLIVLIQSMVFVLLSCIFLDMAIHKH